jgi:hypothetical protein
MTPDTQTLIDLLPPGTPERRLEAFLAMTAVIAYMLRSPGEYVTLTLCDAPRVAIVSRIPLLAIRSAIVRLERQPPG